MVTNSQPPHSEPPLLLLLRPDVVMTNRVNLMSLINHFYVLYPVPTTAVVVVVAVDGLAGVIHGRRNPGSVS